MIKKKIVEKKLQIISAYLTGNESFKQLGIKYGVKDRTIQSWVRTYKKSHPVDPPVIGASGNMKILKKQLEQANLKNELLEEMLRLSEKHTGIDLRKKYGTRQS